MPRKEEKEKELIKKFLEKRITEKELIEKILTEKELTEKILTEKELIETDYIIKVILLKKEKRTKNMVEEKIHILQISCSMPGSVPFLNGIPLK